MACGTLCYTGTDMRRPQVLEAVALVAALALFLALALYQLDLPGLYYDEAADAVPAMQLVQGQPVELFRGAGVWIGDRAFPLMVMDYVGAVNTYILVPFFALLGAGVESMRLMVVVAGAAGIVLTFFLARTLFGPAVAALASLLLAVHPSFIFWSRQGIYVTSVMLPLALGGMLCLRRWHSTSRAIYLIAGLFLLGLGVSAKLLFLWVLVAIGLLYMVLSRKPAPLSHGMSGAVALAVGAALPLLYNAESQGTLSLLSRNLVQTEQGVNNLALWPNLTARLGDVQVLLDGSFFWFLGGIFRASLYPWLGLGAAAGVVALSSLPRFSAHRRKIAVLVGFSLLVFIQSGVTISGLWPTHFYILLPFFAIAIALFVQFVSQVLPWRRAGWVAGLAIWALAFFPSLWTDVQYHVALGETGGWMAHSDGVYRLAQALEQRGDRQPLAMDWGIKSSVQLLTQGRVNPQEVFEYQPEPDQTFFDLTYKAMQDTRRIYVFRAGELTVYPRMDAFESLVKRLGKTSHLEETISQRDGRPLYLIYTAR